MKKYKLLITISSIILAQSCARFKVDQLKAEVVHSVKINQGELSLKIPQNKTIYYGLPGRVAFTEERLVVPETENQAIKIFGPDGLEVIIASEEKAKILIKKKRKNKKGILSKINIISSSLLYYPGMIIAGNDEDFFVINKVTIKAKEENKKKDTLQTNPSLKGYFKILHFDLKGKFLHELGRQGQVQLPFENIIWMDVDKNNHLWVLFRNLGQIYLEEFEDQNLKKSLNQANCVNILFAKVTKEKNYLYSCEYMYPFYDGEKTLMIGKVEKISDDKRRGGYTFKYRVFLSYDNESKKTKEIFNQLNDPDDYPYLPFDNNRFILWQTKDDYTFRFALYNLQGDLTNNLQVKLTGRRTNWRSTYFNLNGSIESIRIMDSQFQLLRWN